MKTFNDYLDKRGGKLINGYKEIKLNKCSYRCCAYISKL